METIIGYCVLLGTLSFFGYVGFRNSGKKVERDEYLSARGSQKPLRIALSLFASGMGIWVLFGPPEAAFWGNFWDVLGYAVACALPFVILAYLGPVIRSKLPDGVTLADYVRMRIGRPMQIYVGLISILYMFTILFGEFTAIGKAMSHLTGMNALVPMLAVALITTAYTTYGGLPASLRTDRWQAWVVIWLITVLFLILFGSNFGELMKNARAFNSWGEYGSISHFSWASAASGFALVVAITSAEMFSQGNWQRAYASEDDKALKKGALLAAALVFPLIFTMGFLGTVVSGQDVNADPTIAFFLLIDDIGIIITAAFIVLVIALVCSSADTLQNAIVASICRDLADGKMELKHARIATLSLIPIAVWFATSPTVGPFSVNATSVFAIFLFADLLATATVAPIFLSIHSKISSRSCLFGAFGGIISVILYGCFTADLSTGIHYIWSPTNEYGLANLGVFLSALIGSIIFCLFTNLTTLANESNRTNTQDPHQEE